MRKFISILILSIIFIASQSCYKEKLSYNPEPNSKLELSTIIKINDKECCYDKNSNFLRYPIDDSIIDNFTAYIEFQEFSDVYFEGVKLTNNSQNSLGKVKLNEEYIVTIKTGELSKEMILSFTNLPTVQIVTSDPIYDEPKSLAKMTINYNNPTEESDSYNIGIEHRGGSAQSYIKKSYGFALFDNLSLDSEISKSICNMKPNNDWILDAMWIDKSRLRNISSFEIWQSFGEIDNYSINGKFVELFINREFQGLYCLNEKINPELIDMYNSDAALYKAIEWESGATNFETYTQVPQNFYWDGWEQKYPDPKHTINWSYLDELRKLILDKDDETFSDEVSNLINIDNFIDYYIFLNLVYAQDNTGKNIFYAKNDANDKFYIIPWDIDASWGLFWDGSHQNQHSILTNNLYSRLIDLNVSNFKEKTKLRWQFLRNNSLSQENILLVFNNNFYIIEKSGVIPLENQKWDTNIDYQNEQEYLNDWLYNHLIYLDTYFENL